MKRIILAALGLSLVASSALAQADAPPPPPPMQGDQADRPPPPEDAGGRGPHADRDQAGRDQEWDHGPRRKGPRGGPDRDAPPPPPPSRAAEFVFKHGPMEMRIKCSEFEPIKPCVDGALAMIHELGAMRGGPAVPGDDMAPTPPPPPGAAPGTEAAPPPPPPAGDETVQ